MVVSLGFLMICLFFDIKNRRIPGAVIIAGVIVALIVRFILGTLAEAILALLPGAVLLVLNKVTREAIGKGDCFEVAIVGEICSLYFVVEALFLALLLCSVWGVGIGLKEKRWRGYRIIFTPFFLLAVGICWGGYFIE